MFNNPYNYYPYMNIPNRMAMNTATMGSGMAMNPYMQGGISSLVRPRPSLFKGLANIKWGSVLNNTQKTLNVINQAIPVYYQVKPIFSNVKSFGRLISAFNEEDTSKSNSQDNLNTNKEKENSSNSPTFFIN